MNNTTPPPGTPGDSQATGPSYERTSERFFSWLRGLDITRSSDRWFAGVAGGIAAKAHIDPLIVRGVFVVLAILGGPGILLYLAGWLLLPDQTGRIHLEDLLRGRASAGAIATAVVLGAILIVPAVVWIFRALFLGPWSWNAWGILPDWAQLTFGIIWWAVVVPALIVWLIVWLSGRSGRGSPSAPSTAGAEGAAAGGFADTAHQFAGKAGDFAEKAAGRATEWGEDFGQKAEAWGQRVEEKSKQWEQYGREYHEAHRLGAAHVVITLALTLLAAGAAAGWALLVLGASADLVLTAGLVSGVAVLAISCIIAGVRGRDSGWIGFLSFCGVIALIFAPFSTVLPQQTEVVPFGDSSIRASADGGDRAIVSLGGNATVDLSDIGRGAHPRTIDVWLAGGNATVRLPEAFATRVSVNLLAGNIRDQRLAPDERRQGGILMSRVIEQHTEGVADSGLITVRVRMLGGNIYIENGSGSRSQASEDRKAEIDDLKQRLEELENAR